MARYTGPAWKVSRRLKFSTLENGKEFGIGANGKQKRDYVHRIYSIVITIRNISRARTQKSEYS